MKKGEKRAKLVGRNIRTFSLFFSLAAVGFRCLYLDDRDYERTGDERGEHAPEELGARRRCAVVSTFGGDASMPMLACFLAQSAGLARGGLAWRAGDNAPRRGLGHCVYVCLDFFQDEARRRGDMASRTRRTVLFQLRKSLREIKKSLLAAKEKN